MNHLQRKLSRIFGVGVKDVKHVIIPWRKCQDVPRFLRKLDEFERRSRKSKFVVVVLLLCATATFAAQSPKGAQQYPKLGTTKTVAKTVGTATSPVFPSSFLQPAEEQFHITNIVRNPGGTFVVRWSGAPAGSTYQLLKKTNVTSSTWQPLGAPTTSTAATNPMIGLFAALKVQAAVTNTVPGSGTNLLARYITGPLTADILNAFGLAVDSSSNIVIAGAFNGSINFGGTTLTSSGDFDGFVAKYSAAGTLLWANRMGGLAGDYAYSVAVDRSNNVLVAGLFSTTANFGGAPLTSAGGGDIFVVKFSASGAHLWSKGFGGTGGDFAQAVAVDAANNVIIGGRFGFGFAGGREVDFGGGLLAPLGSSYDVFAAKFNASGAHLWSRRAGGTQIDNLKTLVVDSAGDVLIGAEFEGTADYGGGNLVSAGFADIVIAKYGGVSGNHLMSRRFGGTATDAIASMVLDPANNPILTGIFKSTIDFGGGAMTTSGAADFYLAKLTPIGTHIWSKKFISGLTGRDLVYSVTLDRSGNIALAGGMLSAMSFGGPALTNPLGSGSVDTFLAKFTSVGDHVWSHRYGAELDDWASGLATDGTNFIATGQFNGRIQFGGAIQQNTGGLDGFIAKFAP